VPPTLTAACAGLLGPVVTGGPTRAGLGKVRWVVGRGLAWLHAFKRLRTRYERRADIHLGLLRFACALICH
jgi:transposase